MSNSLPLFKFILVGESGVGKSSLLLRYTNNQFLENYNVTVGVEFSSKTVLIDSHTKAKIQIWDAAGQETFKSIIRGFYRNVAAIFLVYSIVKKDSLEKLQGWLSEAKENSLEGAIIVLVGAQCDLEDQRVIFPEEAQSFMDRCKIHLHFETSAKTDQNVDLAFTEATKLVFLSYLKKSIYLGLPQGANKQSIALSSGVDEDRHQKKNEKCC